MKTKGIISAISGILFLALIFVVRTVDVAPIGPEQTRIGLSAINDSVRAFFGVNMTLNTITNHIGNAAILTAAFFAFVGLYQWIRRKNMFRVDCEILLLGVAFLCAIGSYFLFENVIVNYRPILMPDGTGPEASFPSSHTMTVCVVLGCVYVLLNSYIRKKGLLWFLRAVCLVGIAAIVAMRLISGVHWFSDIVGGMLLSMALIFGYAYFLDLVKSHIRT